MKKLLITALFIIGIAGCSSDDSAESSNTQDQIIGKWRLVKEVFYMDNQGTYEIQADQCETLSSTEYKTNNSVAGIYYTDNESQGVCQIENIDWIYNNWTFLGQNMYQFKSKIQGENEEIYTRKVLFSSNNMIIESTYFDGDSNNKRESVYIKLN